MPSDGEKNLGVFFSQQIFYLFFFLGKPDFPMSLVNQFLTDNILSLFILTALILTARLLSYSLSYYRLLQKPLWFYLVRFIWSTSLLKSKKKKSCRLFWGVLVGYFDCLLSFSFFSCNLLKSAEQASRTVEIPPLNQLTEMKLLSTSANRTTTSESTQLWALFFPLSGQKYWTMLHRSLQEICGTLKK